MHFNKKTTPKLSILFSILLLTACGSNNDPSTDVGVKQSDQTDKITYSTVSGTAFAASALKDATVTAICKDGVGFKNTVMVDEEGKWQGEVDSRKFPCRLEVKANGESYHSYIGQEGSVNINPFTDIALTYASTQMPAIWYQSGIITVDQLKLANSALVAELIKKEYALDGKVDVFNTITAINNPIHQAIQALLEAIQSGKSIQDYNALLTLVKDGNLAQLPIKPDSIVVSPLNLQVNTIACQQYESGMIERYNYCASNVLPDFKEEQLITPFGERCILTKEGSLLTVSNGKITISAIINKDEDDEIPTKTSVGTLFVASNSVSSTLDDVLYNVGISFFPSGQINGVTAGNEKGESLVCATTRPSS